MTETTQPTNDPAPLSDSEANASVSSAEQRNSLNGTSSGQKSVEPFEDRHPIDLLADEFSARLRAGESPSIEEFERRAPDLRTMIRSLFPTIAMIERMTLRDRPERRTQPHSRFDRQSIGDFQIVREIGRGGMGVVYEAIQRSLDRRVALKVLGSGIANSPLQLQRFRREAESAARLHHTNIVPVYGIGEEDGIHFYAMQFIDGIPLADAIETVRQRSSVTHVSSDSHRSDYENEPGSVGISRQGSDVHRLPSSAIDDPTILMTVSPESDSNSQSSPPSENPLNTLGDSSCSGNAETPLVHSVEPSTSPKKVAVTRATTDSVDICFGHFANNQSPEYFLHIAGLTVQVADALEYAHQHGVLHRDIKPSNLMIDRRGGVWIMDFGLVKIIEQKDLTLAGEIVGTVRYMAPEQLEGQSDARTDVYALGLTLFELLTLKPAFAGDEAVTLAQRLRHSEIPRPRSINPAIPQDLETIVLKATAREPFARYGTAAMLADDLRRFCDDRPILARRATYGERLWRWSRRNPALALATASSVLLLWLVAIVASVGWASVNSAMEDVKNAKQRAESNLDFAIDAFDRIFENVTSRGLPRSLSSDVLEAGLEPIQAGSSDDDVRLLNCLLEFYSRFVSENSDNTQLRRRTADAHRRAGAILVRLGRLTEAGEDFDTAIRLLSRILIADPHNVKAVVTLASIHNDIGELYLRRGEFHQTLDSHLEARALLLNLPAEFKLDPSVRFELARATDLFASIDIRSGADKGPETPSSDGPSLTHPFLDADPELGHEHHSETEEVIRPTDLTKPPLPGSGPPDSGGPPPEGTPPGPPPRAKMPDHLKNALPAAFLSGSPPNDGLALTLLEASDGFRSLINDFPENADYQFRFAQCLRHRLVHAASNGEQELVRDTFREANEILERLRVRFPEDPKFLYELADTLTQASRAEDDEHAIESLNRAVSYSERLVERFPTTTEYQLLLGTALARRAAVEATTIATNDPTADPTTDAVVSLRKSIETLDRLAQLFPDQGVIQIPLAKSRQQLGDLLRTSSEFSDDPDQRLEESRIQLQSAIEVFDRYLSRSQFDPVSPRKGPFNFQTRSNLYLSLAETLKQLRRPEEAKQARLKALHRGFDGQQGSGLR